MGDLFQKDSPPIPDYFGLAQQQGGLNREAALTQAQLGHINERTPFGARTWTTDPNDPTRFTLTSELSPEEQKKYERLNQTTMGMLEGGLGYGLPAMNKALQGLANAPDSQIGWDPRYAPNQRLQTDSGYYDLPWAQEDVDFSGAPAMPTPDDVMRQRVEEALYGRETQYLDPQMEKMQNRLDTKLSNQGIFAGSEAFKDSQDVLDEQRRKAYSDARMQAIAGGGQEQTNMFNMGLGARQQGVNEILGQGQFHNQARGELVNQLQNEMSGRNQAITGQANIAGAQQGAVNSGIAARSQQAGVPVNIMNSIMNGSQVNNPNYQPYGAAPNIDPTNVTQAGSNAYQASVNNANASNAAKGNAASTAASLAAAAMLAF